MSDRGIPPGGSPPQHSSEAPPPPNYGDQPPHSEVEPQNNNEQVAPDLNQQGEEVPEHPGASNPQEPVVPMPTGAGVQEEALFEGHGEAVLPGEESEDAYITTDEAEPDDPTGHGEPALPPQQNAGQDPAQRADPSSSDDGFPSQRAATVKHVPKKDVGGKVKKSKAAPKKRKATAPPKRTMGTRRRPITPTPERERRAEDQGSYRCPDRDAARTRRSRSQGPRVETTQQDPPQNRGERLFPGPSGQGHFVPNPDGSGRFIPSRLLQVPVNIRAGYDDLRVLDPQDAEAAAAAIPPLQDLVRDPELHAAAPANGNRDSDDDGYIEDAEAMPPPPQNRRVRTAVRSAQRQRLPQREPAERDAVEDVQRAFEELGSEAASLPRRTRQAREEREAAESESEEEDFIADQLRHDLATLHKAFDKIEEIINIQDLHSEFVESLMIVANNYALILQVDHLRKIRNKKAGPIPMKSVLRAYKRMRDAFEYTKVMFVASKDTIEEPLIELKAKIKAIEVIYAAILDLGVELPGFELLPDDAKSVASSFTSVPVTRGSSTHQRRRQMRTQTISVYERGLREKGRLAIQIYCKETGPERTQELQQLAHVDPIIATYIERYQNFSIYRPAPHELQLREREQGNELVRDPPMEEEPENDENHDSQAQERDTDQDEPEVLPQDPPEDGDPRDHVPQTGAGHGRLLPGTQRRPAAQRRHSVLEDNVPRDRERPGPGPETGRNPSARRNEAGPIRPPRMRDTPHDRDVRDLSRRINDRIDNHITTRPPPTRRNPSREVEDLDASWQPSQEREDHSRTRASALDLEQPGENPFTQREREPSLSFSASPISRGGRNPQLPGRNIPPPRDPRPTRQETHTRRAREEERVQQDYRDPPEDCESRERESPIPPPRRHHHTRGHHHHGGSECGGYYDEVMEPFNKREFYARLPAPWNVQPDAHGNQTHLMQMVKGMQHDANSKKEGSNARVFNGKASEYFEWRRFFIHWIHKLNLPVKYKCHFLTFFVKKGMDQALDQIVFDKSPDEISYERIIISLEEYYGGETKAVDLALRKLQRTARIKLDKFQTILNAWAAVNEFVNFCKDNSMEHYLFKESLMPKKVFDAIATPEVIREMDKSALIQPSEYINRPKQSIYRLQTYLHLLQATERDAREAISFRQETAKTKMGITHSKPVFMAAEASPEQETHSDGSENVAEPEEEDSNAIFYINEEMVPENTCLTSFVKGGYSLPSCDCCKEGHHLLYMCKKYQEWSVKHREAFVNSTGRCLNCLSPKHGWKNCKSIRCRFCDKKHHSSLCYKGSWPIPSDQLKSKTVHFKNVASKNTPKQAGAAALSPKPQSKKISSRKGTPKQDNRPKVFLHMDPYEQRTESSASEPEDAVQDNNEAS